jgi:long-chain acyl-CoA synthetase
MRMDNVMSNAEPKLAHECHYGDRVVTCFAERPATIDALFRRAVTAHPDRIAIALGETRLSYGVLDRTVDAVAGNLAHLGLRQGERLALLVGNCPEFLITVLAAARLGVIVVPMSTRQTRPEIRFMLTQCTAAALVYDTAFSVNLPPWGDIPSVRLRIVVGDGGETPFSDLTRAAVPPRAVIGEDDDVCLLYTSGTTGRPKGARLTHFGVIHSVMHFHDAMELRDGDVSVLAVPASHVTGLVAILLTMIGVAGTTIAMPEFKARAFLQLAAHERMTHALLVPAMYNLCLMDPEFTSFDLGAWRVGGFGGAPMPETTIERLACALPNLDMRNIYGATETTSPVTMMPRGAIAGRLDTVGRPLACADIVVMDEALRQCAPGGAGELWIAGPMVVPGYWDNPEADATAFCGGYWKSGDIGSIDSDGFVRILDRRKDVINRGGYKVYSVEVENVLVQHPAVVEAAVVPIPDTVLGERVHAFVVASASVAPAELTTLCREALSDYKVPTSFTIQAAPLPRNANGKVLKRDLQARANG